MKAPRIAIIIGSTRPGRNGEAVAKWVYEIAQKRTDAEFELVDIKAICKPRLVERFAVQRSGLNILVGRRDIPGRNREHLSSRQREPGFLEDRTTDVIDWTARTDREEAHALKTYQEDSSPLSSSPLMPRGPALNQIFMMSRTRRCVIQGAPA